MSFLLTYFVWDPIPELPYIAEAINWPVRWYGLMFAIGFFVSQQIMFYIFRKDGKPEKDVEYLTIYMLIATVVGARLGHMLFYEPDRLLADPVSLFMIHEGGLASHGGAIGILIALWLYTKKRPDQSYLWILDRIVIVVALTGALIRFGNFVNSEILGKPTGSDFGVVFARVGERFIEEKYGDAVEESEAYKGASMEVAKEGLVPVDIRITFSKALNQPEGSMRQFVEDRLYNDFMGNAQVTEQLTLPLENYYSLEQERGQYVVTLHALGIPRHPAQLYESIYCIFLLVFLFWLWHSRRDRLPEGQLFGLFLIILFSLRFLDEMLKENQEAFEDQLVLNMGQILSIPLVIAGIVVLVLINRNKNKKNETAVKA